MGNPEKVKRTAPKSAGGTAEGRFRSKNYNHSIANQRSSDNIFQTIKNKDPSLHSVVDKIGF